MRIFSALLLCGALTACGSTGGETPAEDVQAAGNGDDGKLDCALAGASDFKRICQLERVYRQDDLELIFRHPDGGFRRFVIVPGKGVDVADGSETATVTTLASDKIEVQVGNDRYHLPATVKSGAEGAAETDDNAPQA